MYEEKGKKMSKGREYKKDNIRKRRRKNAHLKRYGRQPESLELCQIWLAVGQTLGEFFFLVSPAGEALGEEELL